MQSLRFIELIRGVVTLGSPPGSRNLVEGIETLGRFSLRRYPGWHVGQGYLLARPLRADLVPAALAAPALLGA
ncbi:MAG: hypothetical protein KDG57_17845 [Rhodoferax sp.]|nr:hypothetical protein [Rhodoferax sp.]